MANNSDRTTSTAASTAVKTMPAAGPAAFAGVVSAANAGTANVCYGLGCGYLDGQVCSRLKPLLRVLVLLRPTLAADGWRQLLLLDALMPMDLNPFVALTVRPGFGDPASQADTATQRSFIPPSISKE